MTQEPEDIPLDHPWFHEETTNLVTHDPQNCNSCNDFLTHYRETGMDPNDSSFMEACRAAETEIRASFRSTFNELHELTKNYSTMKEMRLQIGQGKRELKAIAQETWELKRELQKLREVRGKDNRPVVSLVTLLNSTSLTPTTQGLGCRPHTNTACTIRQAIRANNRRRLRQRCGDHLRFVLRWIAWLLKYLHAHTALSSFLALASVLGEHGARADSRPPSVYIMS